MKPASLLTALALCGLLVPAAAPLPAIAQQPAAASPAGSNLVERNTANTKVIEIASEEAFEFAFAPDSELMKLSDATPEGQMASATLRLATGRYALPNEINVPRVHVTITSADAVDPVGVAHRDATRPKGQGATLVHKEDEHFETQIKSPVTISNVHLELNQDGRRAFEPSSELTILNANIYGKPGLSTPPLLIDLSEGNESPKVSIRDSRLDDVRAIRLFKTLGTTHFEGNVFANQRGAFETMRLDFGIGHKPVPATPASHVVRNNLFNQKSFNTAIVASRPGVLIEHNEFFTLDNGRNASKAIEPGLFRSFYDARMLISNMVIRKNRFTGAQQPVKAIGLELLYSDSFAAKQLKIEDNDFSGIETGIKVLGPWTSNDPLVVDNNFLGSATSNLAAEVATNPRTTAPADAGLLKPGTPAPPVGPPPAAPPAAPPPAAPPAVPPVVPPVVPPAVPPAVPPVSPPKPQPQPQPQPPRPQPQPQPQPSAKPTPSIPPGTPPSTPPSEAPSETPRGPLKAVRHAGETRFETAAQLAGQFDTSAHKTVIVARHDVAADSVSAVPLAAARKAPVLLTQPDQLHPATSAAIKKALPKGGTVIIMGGPVAVSAQVEAAIKALGVATERVAGVNRAATAVAMAERLEPLGKATQVLLADGADWQPDLIAGPAAAQVNGVTLLTNGAQMAPETTAYLAKHQQKRTVAIGANATKATKTNKAIDAPDPSTLSAKVAAEFFTQPESAGLATTQDFADALAGGAYMGMVGGPILLTPPTPAEPVVQYVKAAKHASTVHVFGGETRLPDQTVRRLTEARP